jgi:hypothetical protein
VSRHFSLDTRRLILASLLLAGCGSATTARGGSPAIPRRAAAPSGPAAPTKASGLLYHPVRDRGYVIERHDSLTLEYPGGAIQDQVRDRIAHIRLTVAEAGEPGLYEMTIELDSLQALENGAPVAPDSVVAALGTRWTATLSSTGKLSTLQADRSGSLSDELTGRLRLLFPEFPADGARPGSEWTDTTMYRVVADAFPGTEESVTTYRAVGSSGSRQGITLESTGSYSRTGTRLQAEQELQMAGTGTRRGTYRLGPDGLLQSARGSDTGDMTVTVVSVGQTVPVKQGGSFSVVAAGLSERP